MNSATSTFTPDSSGASPKQSGGIPNLTLNDGNQLPMLAYGVGTAHYNQSDDHVSGVTNLAIKTGYTHLDGAEVYGNETGLGRAIKESGVPRSKLYVVTKLHPATTTDVQASFDASLSRLGLDYVDLYLIHAPFATESSPQAVQALWAEVEAVHASGRARSVGVSNFLQPHLEALLETAKVVPAINQIEFHPYLQHGDLLDFHRAKGIAVSAYGPLTPIVRCPGGPVDAAADRLAAKYGVTPGDVLLRWCVDQGVVAVTTSASETRLAGYMNKVPSFKLTPAEVGEISELGRGKHYRAFWQEKFGDDDRR